MKKILFLIVLIIAVLYLFKDNNDPEELVYSSSVRNMGVNIHFYNGNKKDWSMISNAGIQLVRMDVSWAGVEKEKGVYDFSGHDKLIEKLREKGMRLLFILNYGNPLYDNGKAPFTDEGRKAFARFVTDVVKRYKGNDIIWEIWNEPNLGNFWKPEPNADDYMKLSRITSDAIRNADKEAFIAGPATSGLDFNFLETCFRQGYLDLVDAITVHPYRSPDRGPETVFNEYQLLKAMIGKYKPEDKYIPVFSGEWGYNTTVMSRELQGKYLPRQWLANISAGVPFSIWYDWHDDGKDPEEPEHNFGTVTWDYNPKPSYTSMSRLLSELNGYKYLTRLDTGSPDDYILLFGKGNEHKLAYWTINSDHDITLEQDNTKKSLTLYLTDSPNYKTIGKTWYTKVCERINAMTINEADDVSEALLTGKKDKDRTAGKLLKHVPEDPDMVYSLLTHLAEKNSKETAVKMYKFILNSNAGILSKKYSIYGIMKYGSNSDVAIVKSFINDPELSQDAANCLMFFAYDLALKGMKKEAFSLLQSGIRSSPAVFFADRAASIMKLGTEKRKELSDAGGFIGDWKVAGPFPHEGLPEIENAFETHGKLDVKNSYHINERTVKWTDLKTKNIWGIVSLSEMYGTIRASSYLYTEIDSERDKKVVIKIGSNDGVVCWLNGKKIHEHLNGRPLVVDNDIFNADLKKGKNRLLLKVINEGNKWEACIRMNDMLSGN